MSQWLLCSGPQGVGTGMALGALLGLAADLLITTAELIMIILWLKEYWNISENDRQK